MNKSQMKISLLTLICSNRTLEEAITLANDYGYDGVELWGSEKHFGPDTEKERALEIKMLVEYKGMAIPSIASYVGSFSTKSDEECENEYKTLEKYLNLMEIINCDMIRVACGGPSVLISRKYHFEKAVYWISRCAELAKQYNKKIVMEIHNGSLIETIESASEFIKAVNADNVGLIHDAGNMYITDTDYGERSVELLGNKIFHVHVKDELRIKDDSLPGAFRDRTMHGDEIFAQKSLGEGAVDHIPLFRGLLAAGYSGFLSAECHAPKTDIERIQSEIIEIRKLIKTAEQEQA